MSKATNETAAYLPVSWTITSTNTTTHTCPTPSALLGTFAIVNGIVSLFAVLFGHRRVVQEFTCGFFGSRGSQSWKVLWILLVGLHLAANASIALLITRTDGYASDVRVSELMLWLTARPRLSWIVLGAFAWKKHSTAPYPHGGSRNESSSRLMITGSYTDVRPSLRASQHSSYTELRPSPYSSQHSSYYDSQRSLSNPYIHDPRDNVYIADSQDDYPWWSAFMAQFIAEFVLQTMALYVMGRTAHYGEARNYYKIYLAGYKEIPAAARMMYSGALYYLVAGSLFLIFAFFFITYQMFSSKVKILGKGNTVAIVISLTFLLISTWLGSWLFWAGFVKLAGDLYCPPKLIHQGVIWTFFSTIGIVVGTGI